MRIFFNIRLHTRRLQMRSLESSDFEVLRVVPQTAILLLLLAVVSVAQVGSPSAPNHQAQNAISVEMAYCGAESQKPPLEKLFFDVWMRNTAQEQSWVLLPLSFYEGASRYTNDGGIEAVEVLAPKKQELKLIKFIGRFRLLPEVTNEAGGFQGILLPGGASVFVHNLVIEFWGRPQRPLVLTVVFARSIMIGGQAVQHRVHTQLESKTSTAETLSLADSWHTRDWGEVPAAVRRTGQLLIQDALAKPCSEESQQPKDKR